MKVGDLVRYGKSGATGIVIETGLDVGSLYVKVIWEDDTIFTERSSSLEVINERR